MKINMKNVALAATAAVLALSPEAAHAFSAATTVQAGTGVDIAGQMGQMATQTSGTPALIAWAGYMIGAFFICIGIFKLKAHSDNAAQNKLGPALGLLFTGAAFLVMPSAASVMIKSSAMTGGAAYNAAGFN